MGLQVIGLVSGGKDSFYSLLHCLVQGHQVVALANLYPGDERGEGEEGEEGDLNSFMYQTVGHEVVPLYGEVTGLPLYRQAIEGQAVQQGREYAADETTTGTTGTMGDETESMTRLLRRVMAAHPSAEAVCAGAILSTYQRTRVESVAGRLGLVSLAYLWQLPRQLSSSSRSTYLGDLGLAGLDARIVKVASGGLDEQMLWADVASASGQTRLQRALQRFGRLNGENCADDSVAMLLGEGGEYETLVLDGPRALFRVGAVAVAEENCRVVREGGGSAWLQVGKAVVKGKGREDEDEKKDKQTAQVRVPGILDPRFESVLADLKSLAAAETVSSTSIPTSTFSTLSLPISTWSVLPEQCDCLIGEAAQSVVDQVRVRLQQLWPTTESPPEPTHCIIRTLVVLRRMADFAAVNAVYGRLFGSAQPNPPARVAISCGDLLPDGLDVAMHLTVLLPPLAASTSTPTLSSDRQGLHVQSRSYWAPANIGPYSQAVSVRVDVDVDGDVDQADGPRLVCIAGQIPLVPASMDLPDAAVETGALVGEQLLPLVVSGPGLASSSVRAPSPPASFAFQATLALQHLWRVGTAVDVRWWAGAVAYVPRQSGLAAGGLSRQAIDVAKAWRAAHAWRPELADSSDDDNDDGPDLWDRHFDARHYQLAGDDSNNSSTALQLPDWTAVAPASASSSTVPPVFLAEVEELPRGAAVEWHALAGFSHVTAGSIEQHTTRHGPGSGFVQYQTAVKDSRLKQTVRMWPRGADAGTLAEAALLDGTAAELVYVDPASCSLSAITWTSVPVVPCISLWNGDGERLAAVVVG